MLLEEKCEECFKALNEDPDRRRPFPCGLGRHPVLVQCRPIRVIEVLSWRRPTRPFQIQSVRGYTVAAPVLGQFDLDRNTIL